MPDARDPRSDDPDRRPLDELFIVGAKYHEPTAAERSAAARRSDQERKKRDKLRDKEVAHTRKVLGLDGGASSRGSTDAQYNPRTAAIAFAAMLVVAALLTLTPFVG